MEQYAVIVAGGSGSRMQSATPKQFLKIGEKPILLHTLETFHAFNPTMQIILVLPAAQKELWKEIKRTYHCQVPHAIAEGGDSRFQSVRNGLALVPFDALVAIHDGVRPFVKKETLQLAFSTAAEKGSAITSIPLKESIRRLVADGSKAEDRNQFRLVQTPQTFQSRLIKRAYRQGESPLFSDCASVAEAAGHSITLIEGGYENIKVTTPEDLLIAEAFLTNKKL